MIRIYKNIEFAVDRRLATIMAEKNFVDFDKCCQHALINGRHVSWAAIAEYVTPQLLFERSWDPATEAIPRTFYVDPLGQFYEDLD